MSSQGYEKLILFKLQVEFRKFTKDSSVNSAKAASFINQSCKLEGFIGAELFQYVVKLLIESFEASNNFIKCDEHTNTKLSPCMKLQLILNKP